MDFKPKIYQSKNKRFMVFLGLCKGCGLCIEKCPQKAISFSKDDVGVYKTPAVTIDLNKCNGCGICITACPDCALKLSNKD